MIDIGNCKMTTKSIYLNKTYLVSNVQDILEIFTHPVMFYGEEDGVQDDAEGHDHIKKCVIDHFVEEILKLQPQRIVDTTSFTATTVSVGA